MVGNRLKHQDPFNESPKCSEVGMYLILIDHHLIYPTILGFESETLPLK